METTDKNTQNKEAENRPVKEGRRLLIHLSIIVVLIFLGAVAAHFSLVIFTRHDARCTVPQFKGLIINEAEYLAASNDLQIIVNDSLYAPMYEGGMVLEQLPKADVEVKPGRKIYVTINAFGSKMVTVPYVAGRSLRQAKNMLEVAGLHIEKLVYKEDMATNYVLAEYSNDKEILEGSDIEVVVGSGVVLHVGMSGKESTTMMPLLVGLTLKDAKSRIWETGLNVGKINMLSDVTADNRDQARVFAQGLILGDSVKFGEYVSLTITTNNSNIDKILSEIEKENLRAQKERERIADSLQMVKLREESLKVDSFFE